MNESLKIMLVDDQKMANFINKKLIEITDFAHNIVDYTLPDAALLDIENEKPDLIFLDLNMPIIDGWKFLDSLQQNKNSTRVVIVTSSTSALDKKKAQSYTQVVDFLIKPLTRDTILSLKSKLNLAS